MNWKLGRRSFLSSLGAAAAGLLSPGNLNATALMTGAAPHASKMAGMKVDGDAIVPIKSGFGSTGDIYAELGITPLINSSGIISVIGGSVMKPEVMEIMRQGNEHFVFMDDLYAAAGKYIAKICKAPAGYTGMVSNGAAGAMVIGYAGMMTEDYEPRLEAIPDLRGFPRTEVIIQRAHRSAFDHQIRQLGAKLVVVETRDEMLAAINPRTVAIHYSNTAGPRGQVNGPETISIAKAHNIYTFNDASADVPPKSRLWEYPAMGFDIVSFSGGKDICGPTSSGVMIGKEDLIRWSILNMSPQEDRIGRVCKIGKEQVFALVKALDMFVNQDEDAMIAKYDAKAQFISDAVSKLGVVGSRTYNLSVSTASTPRYTWTWDPTKIKLTGKQVNEALFATRPVAIGYIIPPDYDPNDGSHGRRGRLDPNMPPMDPTRYGGNGQPRSPRAGAPQNDNSVSFTFWQVKDGEERVIADRLVEIFSSAKA